MRLVLVGRGKMGSLLETAAREAGDQVLAALGRDGLDRLGELEGADAVIDFSRPEALEAVCAYVRRTGTPLVSGTTGYTAGQLAKLQELGAFAPVLWSANFSVGVAVLQRALAQISGALLADFDVEIVETHHNQKADAPSGTARLLLSAIDPEGAYAPVYGREGNTGKRERQEIGVHALRGGSAAGTHTVHFLGPDEELELTHRAGSRGIFVNGALRMARWLPGKPAGIYDLQTILFGE